MARALKLKGYGVDLAYTQNPVSKIYPHLSDSIYNNNIKVNTVSELRNLAKKYDIVHSHNEPDDLTIALIPAKVKLIHDSHDMISLRPTWNNILQRQVILNETVAQRGATGRVYVSDFMLKIARERYQIDPEKSIVYGNYVNKEDIPDRLPPRLDKQGVHIVYEGGLGIPGTHRDSGHIFKVLYDAGVHVHVYPAAHTMEQAEKLGKSPFLHIHQPVSPHKVIEEIARYDYGIIPFNIFPENITFLNQSMPNKLYEYLAAGLPVIAPRLFSLERFINKTGTGIIYNNPGEILTRLKTLAEIKSSNHITKHALTHDDKIEDLLKFYHRILKED